jgi:putative tricarboxylic transport membrane protein
MMMKPVRPAPSGQEVASPVASFILHEAPPAADSESRPGAPGSAGTALLVYRLVALLFLLLGLFVCWQALGMVYYMPIGPGPGFFPLYLGLLMSVVALAVLARSFLGSVPDFSAPFLPARKPLAQMAATVAAIAVFGVCVERLGFAITMFLVLLALLSVRGCRMLPTGLAVAVGGSFGVGYAFSQWLGVYLPPAPGHILQFIGL